MEDAAYATCVDVPSVAEAAPDHTPPIDDDMCSTDYYKSLFDTFADLDWLQALRELIGDMPSGSHSTTTTTSDASEALPAPAALEESPCEEDDSDTTPRKWSGYVPYRAWTLRALRRANGRATDREMLREFAQRYADEVGDEDMPRVAHELQDAWFDMQEKVELYLDEDEDTGDWILRMEEE